MEKTTMQRFLTAVLVTVSLVILKNTLPNQNSTSQDVPQVTAISGVNEDKAANYTTSGVLNSACYNNVDVDDPC
jgi:hypothetical protein